MNEMTVFNHEEFGAIRTTVINDEPWFVGKDVAQVLGYQNHSKALADHVDAEDKLNNETLSSLGQRGGWLINALVHDGQGLSAMKCKVIYHYIFFFCEAVELLQCFHERSFFLSRKNAA